MTGRPIHAHFIGAAPAWCPRPRLNLQAAKLLIAMARRPASGGMCRTCRDWRTNPRRRRPRLRLAGALHHSPPQPHRVPAAHALVSPPRRQSQLGRWSRSGPSPANISPPPGSSRHRLRPVPAPDHETRRCIRPPAAFLDLAAGFNRPDGLGSNSRPKPPPGRPQSELGPLQLPRTAGWHAQASFKVS